MAANCTTEEFLDWGYENREEKINHPEALLKKSSSSDKKYRYYFT